MWSFWPSPSLPGFGMNYCSIFTQEQTEMIRHFLIKGGQELISLGNFFFPQIMGEFTAWCPGRKVRGAPWTAGLGPHRLPLPGLGTRAQEGSVQGGKEKQAVCWDVGSPTPRFLLETFPPGPPDPSRGQSSDDVSPAGDTWGAAATRNRAAARRWNRHAAPSFPSQLVTPATRIRPISSKSPLSPEGKRAARWPLP